VIDIINALIGICWDEEEAGELKAHIADEADV
jgi:hypothetical protein